MNSLDVKLTVSEISSILEWASCMANEYWLEVHEEELVKRLKEAKNEMMVSVGKLA